MFDIKRKIKDSLVESDVRKIMKNNKNKNRVGTFYLIYHQRDCTASRALVDDNEVKQSQVSERREEKKRWCDGTKVEWEGGNCGKGGRVKSS